MILFLVFLSQMVFAAPATTLEGQYMHFCYTIGEDTLASTVQIQGAEWVQTHRAFEDEKCQTPYLTFETRYQARVSGSSLDLRIEEVSYSSLTDEVTRALNEISYCGFSDWETQQKKIVTGHLCNEFQTPKVSQVIYSTYSLQTKPDGSVELYLGTSKAGEDGSTPQSRHQGLETIPYKKIVP